MLQVTQNLMTALNKHCAENIHTPPSPPPEALKCFGREDGGFCKTKTGKEMYEA